MTGAALFIGFVVGLSFAVALFLLLPRLPRPDEPHIKDTVRDSKELEKLKKQLDEINAYNGDRR